MDKKLDILYQKTKFCLKLSDKNPNKAIEHLRQLQKQIKSINALTINNNYPNINIDQQQQRKIINLQIIVLNNLACAYNQKGKYKASLYNLEMVKDLQNKLFKTANTNHSKSVDIQYTQQQWRNNPEILHQVATTHSNICAIYSQMGNHDKAIRQIQSAITYLQSNDTTKRSDALAVFYYNYAIQLQHLGMINQAYKKVSKGLTLCANNKPQIQIRLQQCQKSLEQKMRKREKKIGQYLATKYKSSFSKDKQLNLTRNGLSTNYISTKLQKSRSIDRNFSVYAYQIPKSLPRALHPVPKKSQYPIVHCKKNRTSYRDEPSLISKTLVVQSRRKINSMYDQKNEIPMKNRLSLRKKKQTLAKMMRTTNLRELQQLQQ